MILGGKVPISAQPPTPPQPVLCRTCRVAPAKTKSRRCFDCDYDLMIKWTDD